MSRVLNEHGFTLIEVIVSFVIVGIVSVLVILSEVHMVNNFLFANNNATTLQKGQTAITRIQKELNNVKKVYVSTTSGTQIRFTSYKDIVEVDHTLSWGGSGTDLLLDGFILTDKVSNFSLAYYDNYTGSGAQPTWQATSRLIEIKLELTGWQNIISKFNVRVAPSFDILLGT
jgi:prepilin-type N-terminal cleavage/methylation domain-containing protein